jgi:hypothetical protein
MWPVKLILLTVLSFSVKSALSVMIDQSKTPIRLLSGTLKNAHNHPTSHSTTSGVFLLTYNIKLEY